MRLRRPTRYNKQGAASSGSADPTPGTVRDDELVSVPVSPFPTIAAAQTAWLSTEQMRDVDRLMVDDMGIVLVQMMENAGRSLARLTLETTEAERVVVLAGSGGNGGGGLVAARHLHNAGATVTVLTTVPADGLAPVPRHQFDILVAMGVDVQPAPTRPAVPTEVDVIVDAMIGYGLTGPPRSVVAALVDEANAARTPIVALDAPTGLETATGATPGAVIAATATLTLALPKIGLRRHPAVGALYLADISVPSEVYRRLGIGPVPSFRAGPVLAVE